MLNLDRIAGKDTEENKKKFVNSLYHREDLFSEDELGTVAKH